MTLGAATDVPVHRVLQALGSLASGCYFNAFLLCRFAPVHVVVFPASLHSGQNKNCGGWLAGSSCHCWPSADLHIVQHAQLSIATIAKV